MLFVFKKRWISTKKIKMMKIMKDDEGREK